MSALLISVLCLAMVGTSFLSGIFGMAGGMILVGILLVLLPLPEAMMLHGVTQMASNGWRAWLWRTHIQWRVVAWYAAGGVIAALAFFAAHVVPSKPVTFIGLGVLSFTGLLLPSRFAPNIVRRPDAVACGSLCTALQFVAGVSGPIFDVFFVRSELDRKDIVATKAAIQTLGHFLKVAYFGQLLAAGTTEIAPIAVILAVSFAVAGTQLSRSVLDAISDAQFRSWSRGLIVTVASIYLVHGIALLASEQELV